MPFVLIDYIIQAVWSFFNNQLTFIMDRTTRTAGGAEEMLLHVAIRSVDLFIRLHLSFVTFNTCTAPTAMLEMTTGCFNIITFRLLFTYYGLNYANTDCLICCCLQVSSSQAAMYRQFYLNKCHYCLIKQQNIRHFHLQSLDLDVK
jgi:hypothetical protein